MAESLKELRRRIKSIKAIKQVTRAMEMVSAAKLRRAQEVLLAGRPYASKLQELLSFLAGSETVAHHPLFEKRTGNRKTMVVFTSDRGLCGAFNGSIIRCAEQKLEAEPDAQWDLVCIGKQARDHFKRLSKNVVSEHVDTGGRPDTDLAHRISDELLGMFTSEATDEIHLAYPAFITLSTNRPTVAKFLSLDAKELGGQNDEEAEKGPALDYILEPSAAEVFDSLLPRYLTSKIYITLAELFTSEHSARMLAMHNATKNCDDLSDELTLKRNKARQSQITSELSEIIAGAAAV